MKNTQQNKPSVKPLLEPTNKFYQPKKQSTIEKHRMDCLINYIRLTLRSDLSNRLGGNTVFL
jgi:hypothetical protein